MIRKYLSCITVLFILPLFACAQKIIYTEPDRDDVRSVDFDIVGKINNSFIIYKQVRGSYTLSIYNNNMELLDKVQMDFLPDKVISTDIIAYRDYFYFIYQYQRRNVVYCSAARIIGDGKAGEPVILDTTTINFFASNKIYNVLYSEDKKRICVYKINSKDDNNYIFTYSIFDASLNLVSKRTSGIGMRNNTDFLTEFSLDNDGWIGFIKASGSAANNDKGTIQNLTLMVIPPDVDSIIRHPVAMPKIHLDDLRVKLDNTNKRIVMAAFYSGQKRGNIDGLYTVVWDRDTDSLLTAKSLAFSDELKSNAKSDGSFRSAFNDYFLQAIVVRRNGGFVVVSESAYSSSRGAYNNRWDYYGNPYWGSSNSYLYGNSYGYGYSYPWMSPYGYGSQLTRYYADNIAIIAYDSLANLEWASIIPKSQYDDNSDNFIGYGTIVTADKVHFLFNQFSKRTLLLQAQSIEASGKVTPAPTLKELDKGHQFMPRYMKQVSSKEVLIPCQYRNYLCFAKIEF